MKCPFHIFWNEQSLLVCRCGEGQHMNHIGDEVCRVMGSGSARVLLECSRVQTERKNLSAFMAAIASMVTTQDVSLTPQCKYIQTCTLLTCKTIQHSNVYKDTNTHPCQRSQKCWKLLEHGIIRYTVHISNIYFHSTYIVGNPGHQMKSALLLHSKTTSKPLTPCRRFDGACHIFEATSGRSVESFLRRENVDLARLKQFIRNFQLFCLTIHI